MAVRWSSVMLASAADRARVRSAATAVRSGIGALAGGRLPALVVELGVRLDGAALLGSLGVHGGVDADPVEPGLHAAAAKGLQVPVGREEGLLDRIGGLVAIRDHPDDERVQLILVQQHQVVEGAEVAVAGLLDEDEISALDGVV